MKIGETFQVAEPDVISREAMDFLPPYEEPRDAAERKVAEVWAEHLKLDRVGRTDDYFELGGDSFGAVAIAVGLEQAFGTTFRSAAFIEFPTVAQQAKHLASAAGRPAPVTSLAAVQTSGSLPPVFYVHGGLGTTFFDRRFLDLLGPEQPVYFFRLPGIDGKETPLDTIEEIAARYVEQMRQVRPKGPYRITANCSCGMIGLEMALQLQKSGEEVERLLLIDPVAAPNAGGAAGAKNAGFRPWQAIKALFGRETNSLDPDGDWDETVADFIKGHKKAMKFARRLREMDAAEVQGDDFAEVSEESIAHALEVLMKARAAYRPGGRYEGRMDVVVCDLRHAEASSWQTTCRELKLHPVTGRHKDVFTASLPQTVAAMRSVLA